MDFVKLEDVLERALPANEVEVLEWGGKLEVRAITGHELTRVERLATHPRTKEMNGTKANALVVILGCIQPQFTMDHLDKLMRQPPGLVARVAGKIMELSGMAEEGEGDSGES